MSSVLVETSDADFARVVLEARLPVLVDCWAPWCKPCVGMQPSLEAFANSHEGRIIVAKVNVDACTEVARTYGVRSLPTLLLFEDGKVLGKRVGVFSALQMTEWAEEFLRGKKVSESH